MQTTRYFAVGVEQAADGEFVAGECDELSSAQSAIRKARSLAHEKGGAVAFELRGDESSDVPARSKFSRVSESCRPRSVVSFERPNRATSRV